MTHQELVRAYSIILRSIDRGYGRHHVDQALVAQAWFTLSDPHRRRQYHRLLGLSDPAEQEEEAANHEGETSDPDRTLSDFTTSDDGSRVVQDSASFLDDPFTTKQGPTHNDGARKPDTLAKTPGLPPMGTFWNKAYKRPAITGPAPGPAGDGQLQVPHETPIRDLVSSNSLPDLLSTPATASYPVMATPKHPTSSVREETDNRIEGWITTSAKRVREDGIDSEYPSAEKSGRRNIKKPKQVINIPFSLIISKMGRGQYDINGIPKPPPPPRTKAHQFPAEPASSSQSQPSGRPQKTQVVALRQPRDGNISERDGKDIPSKEELSVAKGRGSMAPAMITDPDVPSTDFRAKLILNEEVDKSDGAKGAQDGVREKVDTDNDDDATEKGLERTCSAEYLMM
ncbi:MAG: hypothetical protein Q9169_006010 [Polycauliona sp. 2 TL-2023]